MLPCCSVANASATEGACAPPTGDLVQSLCSHVHVLTHPCIGSLPCVDIAVDPLDGTTACATGKPGAVAVIALAEKGALFNPGPAFYMNKLAVGPAAAAVIDIRCVQTASHV
jgi:hypothetical protein